MTELRLTVLNDSRTGRDRRHFSGRGSGLAFERRNGLEQLFSMPERDAELFEIGLGQIRNDRLVDVMFCKQGRVLAQAVLLEPFGERGARPGHRRDAWFG